MLLKKDYEGGLLATLIQDQEQMRNHDSRNHLPGLVRFNFLIPQFLCGDFFNSIDPQQTSGVQCNRLTSKLDLCRGPNAIRSVEAPRVHLAARQA